MKKHFADLLSLDDVKGVVVLDTTGSAVYQEFNEPPPSFLGPNDFRELLGAVTSVRELEAMYENFRLYIRKYAGGALIVVAGQFALVAMVRLNCDIVIPIISESSDKPKGLGRFFKR
jgi:hypothetical protein